MTQPLFSIVTVTYNSAEWVREAIESVINSSFTNFEYIIADDFSSDDTWQIIESFDDQRIKSFRQQKNISEYPNRNFALSQATGKFLLFVDGDDYLYPDTLQKMSEYIDSYPVVGSIWGIFERFFPGDRLPLLLSPEQIISWLYLGNYPFAHIGFSETLFNVKILKDLGGLPTDFICGDTYIKKLIALEQPILLVPAGMMFWRTSAEQASAKLRKNYDGFRQNVLIDKNILARLASKEINVPLKVIEKNIAIRNIKLLLKHTFLKWKIRDGVQLFDEFNFRIADLRLLFIKGDYSFKKKVAKQYRIK